MKVTYTPDHELTPRAAEAATGCGLESWFGTFDAMGGPGQGRKCIGDFLFKEKKLDAWWSATLVVEYEKARGVVEKDGGVRGYNICVTKTVGAGPEKVYEALTDEKLWMGARAVAEWREGGAYDDGDGHRGVFKRLNAGRMIRFTWAGPGHQQGEEVELKLSAAGARTSIVLNHTRLPDRAAADGMRAAWGQALEKVKVRVA